MFLNTKNINSLANALTSVCKGVLSLAMIGLVLGAAVTAQAAPATQDQMQDPRYFTISRVEIETVDEVLLQEDLVNYGDFWGTNPPNPSDPTNPANPANPFPGPSTGGSIFNPFPGPSTGGSFFPPFPGTEPQGPSAIVVADQIVNLGKKIWDLVKESQPVVNIAVNVASGVPQGITDWRNLQSWQTPKSKLTRMRYINGFGSAAVDFSYRLLYTYGGEYEGRGKYLSQVAVVPANLTVGWGYTFDAKTSVPNLVNVGTKEAPVAGMEVLVQWKVSTILKHEQQTHSYFVRGDGTITNLSNGNE